MANQGTALPGLWDGVKSPASLFDLRKRIEGLFEDFGQGLALPTALPASGAIFWPHAEWNESESSVSVAVELPGVDAKDLNLTVHERAIEITGEKRSEVDEDRAGRRVSERRYGHFSRRFELPFKVDPDAVDAKFTNGVLTVKVGRPAAEAEKTRRIPIKA